MTMSTEKKKIKPDHLEENNRSARQISSAIRTTRKGTAELKTLSHSRWHKIAEQFTHQESGKLAQRCFQMFLLDIGSRC